MGKVLIFLSFIILTMMSVGASVVPQNPIYWLASSSTGYQYLRAVLEIIMLIQFATRPPRHVWMRVLSGIVATTTLILVIQQTYSLNMQPLDTLAILGASMAILITALERKAVKLTISPLLNSVKV